MTFEEWKKAMHEAGYPVPPVVVTAYWDDGKPKTVHCAVCMIPLSGDECVYGCPRGCK